VEHALAMTAKPKQIKTAENADIAENLSKLRSKKKTMTVGKSSISRKNNNTTEKLRKREE